MKNRLGLLTSISLAMVACATTFVGGCSGDDNAVGDAGDAGNDVTLDSGGKDVVNDTTLQDVVNDTTVQDVANDTTGQDVASDVVSSDATSDATGDASDGGPAMCPADAGATFCSGNTLYTCSDGVVGPGTSCAYGCDSNLNACADLVPANQGGSHLALNDTFTCTGTQSNTLGSITAAANQPVAIDTTAMTVTVNGTAVTGLQWGTPYTPTGSGTSAVVLHVQSVSLGDGDAVSITGGHALILLVDKDFTATGTSTSPTVISVAATKYTTAGPGAPSSTAGGTGGTGTTAGHGGGGGAGHGDVGGKGGGGDNNTTTGGAAGATYSIAANTELLEAGENGGTGDLATTAGLGGGGLQITACGTISLSQYVLINASGGGGKGGAHQAALSGNGGGGGGSGGTILLEASSFTVGGSLASNGGGGGGGGASGQGSSDGTDGADWDPTTAVSTAAAGGDTPNVASGKGTGGSGGAGTTTKGGDGTNAGSGIGGGGAGGATGKIFLNVPPNATPPTVGAASPAIKTSTECTSADTTCSYP